MVFADDIRRTILTLADERGTEKTFCPSEVARRIDDEHWPMLMDQVRFVASVLIREGKIIATQGGKEVDMTTSQGPLRLRKV